MLKDRFEQAFSEIAWYNGHEEWLWEVSDRLRLVTHLPVPLHTDEWMTDKHALWMMLVSAFGDWGTSIRSGWIDRTKMAADFIDTVTERHAEWRKEADTNG